MQGDATSALGIAPRVRVRIAVEDWATDWPHAMVEVTHDRVNIRSASGQILVYYGYTAARLTDDGVWEFDGTIEDFTIEPGCAEAPAMDTDRPARELHG